MQDDDFDWTKSNLISKDSGRGVTCEDSIMLVTMSGTYSRNKQQVPRHFRKCFEFACNVFFFSVLMF